MRRKPMLLVGAALMLATAGTIVAYGGSSARAPAARRYRPLLVVVGASFSAGVGAGGHRHAWPQDLARILRWHAVVSADPGAGYVNPGAGERGPFSRLAFRLDLARLDPQVLIIQGGHDDIGRPLPLIRDRVETLVATIHRESPHTRIAILSVFTRGWHPSPQARATDRTVVTAARHADPSVLVFDPLRGRWRFPRVRDRLHPSAAGQSWIAQRLAVGLHQPLRGA